MDNGGGGGGTRIGTVPAARLAAICLAASWFVAVLFGAGSTLWAQNSTPPVRPEDQEFFEQRVRPILVERCLECHSADRKVSGGLRLDGREGWKQGGDRGAAIAPGKVDESLVIQAVRYGDPDLKMPPAGKLSDREIQTLEEWVRRGAPDPRDGAVKLPANASVDPEVARRHWAFQPLRRTVLTAAVADGWTASPLDAFVQAKLRERGWTPSSDADRWQWLRRVSLDLTGLPPTVAEAEAFFADDGVDARQRVVDRLLASPAYGERWARPWLDLVGYADQIGSANNVPAEHAWRYRDYVVRAFNADKSFDDFVREQLAGDLLSAQSLEQRHDQLVATGFLVLGNVNIVEADKLIMRMDLVDQQIEKVGKAFLGMTLNCVRCHDHKFDPLTRRDYYGLAGIFSSTDSTYKAERGLWSSVTKLELPETLDQFAVRQAALQRHDREAAAVDAERATMERQIQERQAALAMAEESVAKSGATTAAAPVTSGSESAKSLDDLKKELSDLRGRRDSLQRRAWHLAYLRPGTPVAFGMRDAAQIADASIQIRGNPHTLGEVVPRGFVAAATLGTAPIPAAHESGRRELAEWLIGPAAHLLSRVTVNRAWHRMFGRGLASSVDYLGLRGDPPTHPELLDWLASDFQASGWSRKRLVRELALSRTYGQSSQVAERSRAAADPDNRWLWHMAPRRLEAEMLRDSALAVSGGLSRKLGGPGLAPEFIENVGGLSPTDVNPISFSLTKFRDEQYRVRTVYLPIVRSSEQRGPAEVLNFFDFTQPGQFAGARPTTTVASQSLFLLNGPLLQEAARRLVDDLEREVPEPGDERRWEWLTRRVLQRPARSEERAAAAQFLMAARDSVKVESNSTGSERQVWEQLAQALLASNEFLFRL